MSAIESIIIVWGIPATIGLIVLACRARAKKRKRHQLLVAAGKRLDLRPYRCNIRWFS